MLTPYIQLTDSKAKIFLALNRYVMTAKDQQPRTKFIEENLLEIRDQVLQHPDIDLAQLPAVTAKDFVALADATTCGSEMLQVLCISSLLEGNLDKNNKIIPATINKTNVAIIFEFAELIKEQEPYLDILKKIYNGDKKSAFDTMKIVSANKQFKKQCTTADELDVICFPYRNAPDDALVSKFETLQHLPQESLGHQYWKLYKRAGFEFPGAENAFSIEFATLHDTSHLLSGYDTSFQGDIYNVTFNQLSDNSPAMTWQLFPWVFCWQLGYPVYDFNMTRTGLIELPLFWEAWMRGHNTKISHFVVNGWDFWDHINTPLAEMKEVYGIPPLRNSSFKGKIEFM